MSLALGVSSPDPPQRALSLDPTGGFAPHGQLPMTRQTDEIRSVLRSSSIETVDGQVYSVSWNILSLLFTCQLTYLRTQDCGPQCWQLA